MEGPRVEVGRYLRRDQAEDRALVLLALGLPYWIESQEGLYALLVPEGAVEIAGAELARYEEERREERLEAREALPPPVGKPGHRAVLSLYVYGWVMAAFFLYQLHAGRTWVERGSANAQAIDAGEWWRTVTALTLHGDFGHLIANIGVGLLFAWALLPWIGVGWTWIGTLLAGALGNAINAWFFEVHDSIGASTAVFGALGVLVGWQVIAIVRRTHPGRHRWRPLLTPVAAGLALLAYLGSGDGSDLHTKVDLTAHLFGMLAGGGIGALLAAFHLPQRTPVAVQRLLALAALALPFLAWSFT